TGYVLEALRAVFFAFFPPATSSASSSLSESSFAASCSMPCPAPFVGWESLHPRRRASAGEATTGAAARRSGFRHTNFQTGDRADVKSANDAVTSRAYAPWRRIAQAIGIRPDESEALGRSPVQRADAFDAQAVVATLRRRGLRRPRGPGTM